MDGVSEERDRNGVGDARLLQGMPAKSPALLAFAVAVLVGWTESPRSHRVRIEGTTAAHGTSPAQETLRWRDFTPCSEAGAELVLSEVVRIGDAEGLGMIERDRVNVMWSQELGWFVLDGDERFKVFDHDGRFVRAVGGAGDGPGEFAVVTGVGVVEGRIVALDAVKRAWQFFDLGGEFVEQRPFGFPGALFVPVGGRRVVVPAMDRRPDFVGYPLHVVDLDEGIPSLHFGADEPARWKATDPWARHAVAGPGSRPGTVWGGKAGIPTAQEWSADGELLRSIEGELDWFPRLDREPEPPGPVIGELMADGGDRLWMRTTVADARARDIFGRAGRTERRDPDGTQAYDIRLDGFDLGRRCHLGSLVWDSPGPRLIDRGGETMVQFVVYDESGVPRVAVHGIGWP